MMSERKLEELYPRAPRYKIEVGDHEIVRFAHSPRGSKTMHTRILDLSESGMAFLVPYLTAPQQDEQIKVEFKAPHTESIACFAKVVRVEIHKTYHKTREPQTFKLVAVEFLNLHPKQRELLSQGIQKQMRQKYAEYRRDQLWTQFVWFFLGMGHRLKKLFSRLFPFVGYRNVKKDESQDTNYIDV
jgi:hypothetical protein